MRNNIGQLVASAWERYVAGTEEDKGLIRDIRRSQSPFWRAAPQAPNVMITSLEIFSKYQELLEGMGKVSQKRVNLERHVHGYDAVRHAITYPDGTVITDLERWQGISTPEQKIQQELSESLEKMLTP